MTAPLAEIVEEGRRVEDACVMARDMNGWGTADFARKVFYQRHGPRLLAVAEAAEELADYADHSGTYCSHVYCDCGYRAARAAFDRAVRGES